MGGRATRCAPARRTQAQRSAESRARIIEAAISCVVEGGTAAATTHRVASRAGLTWGAIQHQFGDKGGILLAVVERSSATLMEQLETVPRTGPIEGRVRGFVRTIWRAYAQPQFRAATEILLASRGDDAIRRPASDLQASMLGQIIGHWHSCFGDTPASARDHEAAQRIALATLAGLGLEVTLADHQRDFEPELSALEDSLTRILMTNSHST